MPRTVECVPANKHKEKDVEAYLVNDRLDSSQMERWQSNDGQRSQVHQTMLVITWAFDR